MRIAMIILRTLMGLLFIFGAVVFFFKLIAPPPMEGIPKAFNDGLNSVGYMFPLIKTIELICGILFVIGRFVPLATILIAPIIVNIFLYHSLVDTSGLPVALFLVLANSFVASYYRDAYKPLLTPNFSRA